MVDMKELLNKTTKVVIENRENECLWRNKTGGAYGFWTTYERTEMGWVVKYYTTSSFDYCKIHGCFRECEDCPEYDEVLGGCTAQPDIIATEELLKEIEKALNNEFMGVEIYANDELLFKKEAKIGCRECRLGLH